MADRPVPIFDGHNDTVLKLELAARAGAPLDLAANAPSLHIDLRRAREAGFAGGFFAMFSPSWIDGQFESFEDPRHFAPLAQAEALEITLALFARLHRLARAEADSLALCPSRAEVAHAMAAGRIAIVPHIEGAEAIDTDFHALEVLHAAGLRSMGIVWSRPNAYGHGAPMALQAPPDPGEGLTGAGRALVAAMEELGILIDLAHLTETGFWDVASLSQRPLMVSHSNAHAVSPNARNLTDRQLAAVAETSGIVGLNFEVTFLDAECRRNPDLPLETCLRHIDHLMRHLGEEGVALGSDFDGCTPPDAIGDVRGFQRLVAAMRQAGYGERLITRICHQNWLDFLHRSRL